MFPAEDILRFGLFELDVRAGQLRKSGARIRLAQQPIQLLSMLLERPGEVITREELRQRLWPQDVFVDFDHGLNKSVQKLRDALGDLADSPRYIETIPRVGYRFIAPVSGGSNPMPQIRDERWSGNGNHPAGVLANTQTVAVPTASHRTRRRTWQWFALAGCVSVVIAVAIWVVHWRSLRMEPIHSLAVLPLDNLSGDHGQDYFADGMTDELTTMLAKNSTLRIISRTSVMQYKGVHRPLREIAQELGVDGVVEGSMARSADKVHMTLQLIQGPSDTHVWAESYDRNANDLVSLPDEAAMAIAKRTNSAVPQRAPPRYISPEAHDAYLHGEYLWYAGVNDEAGKYFRKAVELQPDYALAWAGVSKYYGAGMVDGFLDPRQADEPEEVSARKAIELDDSLPEAHLVLCAALYIKDWDFAAADRECLRAIELDPKFAEAYFFRAKILATLNRHEEAIDLVKKSMELNPFERPWGLAYYYLLSHQYDAGIVEARQRLESDPHNGITLGTLAGLYRSKEMYPEAVLAWQDALVAFGDTASAASVREAFQRGGYRAALLWNLADLKKKSQTQYVSPVDIALQYAQLGQLEETLGQLEEAYQQHSPELLWIQDDSAFDFLHSDERYRSLIKRVGMPPAY